MRRRAARSRLGQLLGIGAFLFTAALLATLGYRLTPPGGAPSVRNRFGLPQRQVAQDASLVLVTIDGLRTGRVGFYGSALPSATPHLDRLAREGFRFEQAVTPSPCSLAAHASILTGLSPAAAGLVSPLSGALPPGRPTLAEILRPAGFRTAAFLGSGGLGRWTGLSRGFDRFDEPRRPELPAPVRPFVERGAPEVLEAARAWVDENFRSRFFLWVQISDPLLPHGPTAAYDRLFRDPYDAEIASADAELGRLFDRLSALGVLGHTIVAVVASHGIGLGAHGEKGAGQYLYDTTIQVPLLLRVPGLAARDRSIPEQVRLVDLAPTFLDLLRVGPPPAFPGKSLVPLLDPAGSLPDLPAASTTEWPAMVLGGPALRALRQGGWKYVEGQPGELYDLRRDPGETTNLAASLASKAAEMREALTAISGAPRADPAPAMGDMARAGPLLEDAASALRAGEIDRAARALEQMAAMAREAGGPTPALSALVGSSLRMRGRDAEALRIYQDALAALHGGTASRPDDGALAGLLNEEIGACQRLAGDRDRAIAAYREAAGALPDDPEPLESLASLYLETGLVPEAIAAFRAALARLPQDPRILAGLGRAYLDEGEAAAAIAPLQEAIRAAPSAARPYFDLARAQESLERPAAAARAYRQFLERAGSSDALREQAAGRLRSLDGSVSSVR